MHALGDALGVLDGHLGLPVGSQIRKRAVLASLRELPRDGVSERDGERHQLRRLPHREPEHHSLIARAELLGVDAFARLDRLVDALRDLRGLLFDRRDDSAGPVIEAVIGVRVPDVAHDVPHEVRHVDVRVGGDLAGDEDHARRRRGLAGDAGVGILPQALVEHAVGHLVAELVGVAFGHRFAREEDAVCRHEGLGHRLRSLLSTTARTRTARMSFRRSSFPWPRACGARSLRPIRAAQGRPAERGSRPL